MTNCPPHMNWSSTSRDLRSEGNSSHSDRTTVEPLVECWKYKISVKFVFGEKSSDHLVEESVEVGQQSVPQRQRQPDVGQRCLVERGGVLPSSICNKVELFSHPRLICFITWERGIRCGSWRAGRTPPAGATARTAQRWWPAG